MSYHEFLLPPANDLCEGNVFTPVCHHVHGEGGWIPSMHHRSHDHGVPPPRGGGSASMVVCLQGGLHLGVGQTTPPPRAARDTVNKREVHILLKCLLVHNMLSYTKLPFSTTGWPRYRENREFGSYFFYLIFGL